ncbi:TonB C-terminal domain-containing protein [Luteimonas sp. 50]|uniref:TonB C-terminal domain-containing protein n=1 Tax=Cognatiluteimonas sedimenti TaxID=2927791 RepID=A0ABT0A491_9GAMM|nr:TonB C-terminal domain-containing protein [Lysobacter sedimenti]MCJ0825795.1 TonB C-terminal domain-containing protein [Lysobacter sedimenti]
MFLGLWWTRTNAPLSAAGPVIEADLVDPDALSAPMRRALDAPAKAPPEPRPVEDAVPPPQPTPEARPQDAPVPPQPQAQEPIPVPDAREQERVERDADAARRAAREQEEKRRQEQVDLTRRERQEAAEKQQRLAQQQFADKLKKIRAEREKAARAADLAEQKLKQLADARTRSTADAATPSDSAASPPPGNNGVDPDLAARYAAALQDAILRNWTRPDTVPLGQRCRITIRQLPGGEVIDAKVAASCPYDELGQRSVEAAVLKAQPLPYAGFEAVFQRTLYLNFEAQDR